MKRLLSKRKILSLAVPASLLAMTALFLLLGAGPIFATGMNVSNVRVGSMQDTTSHVLGIQFDIAWARSWNDSINHDAAWIFMKYSTNGITWKHAHLRRTGADPVADGFSAGSSSGLDALEIVVPADKVGAFLKRSVAITSGDIVSRDVQFVWNYGVDIGTGSADDVMAATLTSIRVMAIEMVYVPQDSFHFSGKVEIGSSIYEKAKDWEYVYDCNRAITDEVVVASSAGVTMKTYPGHIDDNYLGSNGVGIWVKGDIGISLRKAGTGNPPVAPDDVNSNFPTGYGAFYLMKHEASCGQYRDFLNSLTPAQATNRCAAADGMYMWTNSTGSATPRIRNGIKRIGDSYICDLSQNGSVESNGEYIAVGSIGWLDMAAYADWAGLRPITELEFEKACKGPDIKASCMMANGDTTHGYGVYWYNCLIDAAWAGTQNECPGGAPGGSGSFQHVLVMDCSVPDTPQYNIGGPVRCGSHDGSVYPGANTNNWRFYSRSSYYAATELSGNVSEQAISIGSVDGRSFNGTVHGDGELDVSGNADVNGGVSNANWPLDYVAVNKSGRSHRGGHWLLRSYRDSYAEQVGSLGNRQGQYGETPLGDYGIRYNHAGIRCGRSAP